MKSQIIGKILRKFLLASMLLCVVVLCESLLKNTVMCATTTMVELSQIPAEAQVTLSTPSGNPADKNRAHAPEPSTFLLLVSGLGGLLMRFAHNSFEKFKRCLDLSLAVLGFLISAPFVLLAVILVKLTSPGPVIYTQDRVGFNGRIFKIYKLRTMRVDAEKNTGAVWAVKNDPRITPVGKILRMLRIDEIPQLWNVVQGNMSIVGPRPERPEIVRDLKELISDYEKRLLVKPGITGLAQVHIRYDETIDDVRKKIKYDLLYIKKMCWLVEMKILAMTFVVALTGKGSK